METLNGVTIYWLISIGLMIGYIMDLVIGPRGASLASNLAGGTVGSILIGYIAIFMGLFAPLIYASIGTVAFLFLINIFRFEPKYDEHTNISRDS